MKNLQGWVEFGIAPTTSYDAAGYDFYVPNLVTEEQKVLAFEAFKKSYNKTNDELTDIANKLSLYATSKWGSELVDINLHNILHLYLALDSPSIKICSSLDESVDTFVEEYLIFDKSKKVPGIVPDVCDHVIINSGVHVALEDETAGIFYNKSGMGTRGWDTRACVVDQDYSGACHLSASYTKIDREGGKFFCGDKFSQMVVEKIVRGEQFDCMSKEAYEARMANSKRGDGAMGSTDVKHTVVDKS